MKKIQVSMSVKDSIQKIVDHILDSEENFFFEQSEGLTNEEICQNLLFPSAKILEKALENGEFDYIPDKEIQLKVKETNSKEYNIPTWSLPFLAYNEDDNLREEEIELICNFLEWFKGKGNWDFDEETFFHHKPAFGAGSECVIGTFFFND